MRPVIIFLIVMVVAGCAEQQRFAAADHPSPA
jgi:hypothetical protein